MLVLYKTAQQVGKAKIAVEWRSEKRKGQRMLVDVVEAEIVRRDIALAASCSASRTRWSWSPCNFGSIHLVYSK